MDLKNDLFRLTFAKKDAPLKEVIFTKITKLGYKPSLGDAKRFSIGNKLLHPVGDVPETVTKALKKARKESKAFVLVKCIGDR